MKTTQTKDFVSISQKECLTFYKSVIENSDRHFKIAEILSHSKEYANAICHLILGTEELVKASILLLDGIGLDIRHNVSGVRKLFYNHPPRHFLSATFSLTTSIMNPFLKIIYNVRDYIHNDIDYNSLSDIEKAIVNKNKAMLKKTATKEFANYSKKSPTIPTFGKVQIN